MSPRVEGLDWDSAFFGRRIGQADLADLGEGGLAQVDGEARDLGLECLYGTIDSGRVLDLVALGRTPWFLVDVTIVLARDAGLPFDAGAAVGEGRVGVPADLPRLLGAVDRLAPWSRFAVDPRFGIAEARRLLACRLERAIDPDEAERTVHLVEDGGEVTSFLSLELGEPHPRIDLIGAFTPGTGSTDALMDFTLEQVRPCERILGGPIAVRNLHALRYSERCGYRVRSCHYRFHRWYDDDPTPTAPR